MSFVARRYRADEPYRSDTSSLDSGILPAVRTVGVLMVGVDEDIAAIGIATAMELGVSFARSPHGPAACRTMAELSPAVVVVSAHLWRDEREAVAEAAREVGAAVVLDVPAKVDPSELAVAIAHALATDGAERLAG